MADENLPRKGPRVHDKGIVYGLVSAEDPNRIRYVGFTTRALSERVKNHRSDALKGRRKAVSLWVARLIAEDVPFWAVLLKTNAGYPDEIALIAKLKSEGADLLNETDGGVGLRGMAPTAAMRAVYSLPASEKQRDWVRQFNATRDYSTSLAGLRAFQADPENLRRSGAKISAAKARHTPERKAEIAAKRRATIAATHTPEREAAIKAKRCATRAARAFARAEAADAERRTITTDQPKTE